MKMTVNEFNNAVKQVKTAGQLFDFLWKAGAEFNEAAMTTLCKRSEEVILRNVGEDNETVWAILPRIKFIRKKDVPNYLDFTPMEMEIRDLKIHNYKPVIEEIIDNEEDDYDYDDIDWEGDDE